MFMDRSPTTFAFLTVAILILDVPKQNARTGTSARFFGNATLAVPIDEVLFPRFFVRRPLQRQRRPSILLKYYETEIRMPPAIASQAE
jgi:hypothetical protein